MKPATLRNTGQILSVDPIMSKVAYFAEVLSENAARLMVH